MVEKIISTCITAYSQSVELRLLEQWVSNLMKQWERLSVGED